MDWTIAYLAFGRYALPVGLFWIGFMEITPMIVGSVPAVVIALFTGSLAQAFLALALFLVAQRLKGDVFVPKIMGDPVGVPPLLAFFAVRMATAALRYVCEPLPFKRMTTVSKVALGEGEQALIEPTAPGEKPGGFRGFVGREV